MVSNRVKRNISGTLFCVGVFIFIARLWAVITDPASGTAWFNLFCIVVLTALCLMSYNTYRRRLQRGIKFGNS